MKAAAVEVRPLRGLEEADEAARVCKRAFNRIQEPQFGRLVSFPDEEKSCRAHRYFASLERVRPTLFFSFALSPPPPTNHLNFLATRHAPHERELTASRARVCCQTYAVVACDTETGAIIGSNYLDQRDEVASVGA